MQKKLYKRQRIDLILFEYVYCTTVYSLVWIDGISSGFFFETNQFILKNRCLSNIQLKMRLSSKSLWDWDINLDEDSLSLPPTLLNLVVTYRDS
jgi:hypothetical protein